jgi:urea transport system permease protein
MRRRWKELMQLDAKRGANLPAIIKRAAGFWRKQALVLGLLLLLGGVAHAEPDLSAFASDSYSDIRDAVQALASSGDPRAGTILSAMQNDQLYVGPGDTIYIKTDDATVNAATGAPVTDVDPDDLKHVRVNNSVRVSVDTAVGALQLFSTDATQRAAAAEAVFHSHDDAALPALNRAIAQEHDAKIKRVMEQARAAAVLSIGTAPEPERMAAVATLKDRGDMDARALLASVTEPPSVARAAASAVAGIDQMQYIWNGLQSIFYGLSLGSVLLLAAAGLAITFGVMGVINMAHGEMVMIGAYTTFVVQQVIRGYAPGLFGASLFIAIPIAFLVSGAIGVAIERLLIRFLYGRPLETLLATWGLSLVLQQAVRSVFGADNQNVGTPAWMSGSFALGGMVITINRLTIIIFAVLVLAALMATLRYTSLGLRMRAVTQNRRMAAAMGIRTPWIDAMTFGLGSGIAGMAGVALSQIDNVSPNLGQGYIIDSFMVVVFGGVGNLWGTALGALVLGIVNKFLEPVAGAVLGKVVVLVLLILFIQRRPRGIFPLKGRAVET